MKRKQSGYVPAPCIPHPASSIITLLIVMACAAGGPAQILRPGEELPYELCTIDAHGGPPHKVADMPGYTCGSPDWSPDGKSIAFDTWPVGKTFNDSQIAVVRADGSDRHIIGAGGMPNFSPDGAQLVCHTYGKPQTIVVMNADGRGRESIIDHWGSPRWVPNTNFIASLDKNNQICVFDPVTGSERSILPPPYGGGSYHYNSQIGFSFAPDGRSVCFGASDGLFLATLDAQTRLASIRWPVKSGMVRQCSWSPDGKQVAFAWKKTTSSKEQIYIIDINSADPPQWLAGQDARRNNACPDWSPDGKTIVFVSQVLYNIWSTNAPEVHETANP